MRAIELFAGAGGLGLGISSAGFKPLLVVERDRWCCDTLRRNQARTRWPTPYEGDIRSVNFRPFLEKVDVISGGPPCQPFSIGGRHKAHDDHRDMWGESVRAVREARPRAFIFENVKGLVRQSFTTYLGYVVLQLQYPSLARREDEGWREHLGRLERHHTGGGNTEYRVVYQLLNTADYGVPQKRGRVIFVGFRADSHSEWSFPRPTHSREALLFDQSSRGSYWDRHRVASRERTISSVTDATDDVALPWRTVRDALTGLPTPTKDRDDCRWLNHRFQPGAKSYVGHTGSPLDEPAKTLKAGVHGVPGGENMVRYADGSVRYFTVRESARLQAFPDDYAFEGAWSEAMRQLGNAVPVTLGEVIARSVREHLRGR